MGCVGLYFVLSLAPPLNSGEHLATVVVSRSQPLPLYEKEGSGGLLLNVSF